MSKRDIIIVIVLIVVALIGFGVVNFLNKGDQGTVLITVNGAPDTSACNTMS